MKTTIIKNIFKKAVSIVEKCVGKNLNLQILSCVFIGVEKNKMELKATDLECGIICKVLCESEKDGSVVCDSKILSSVVGNIQDDKIEIYQNNNFLNLKTENSNINIKTENKEDFPIIPRIKNNKQIELSVNSKSLCFGLSRVINFVNSTLNKQELSGVFFSFSGDMLKVVATDNFRLAEQKMHLSNKKIVDNTNFILPFKTARILIDIFGEFDGDVNILLSENQIEFLLEDKSSQIYSVELVSKLIEGSFPEYEKMIPLSFSTEAVFNKEEIMKSIRLASIFSSKINDVTLSLNPKENLLKIKSQNQNYGEGESLVKGDISGKEIKISFNHKFLMDGINSFNAEKVFIGFNSDEEPILIKSEEDPDFMYILMPLRVD